MADSRCYDVATRLVEGFGLVEAPLRECASRLDGFEIGTRSTLQVVRSTKEVAEAIDFVSRQLTFPATRHVLIPLDGVTAFVNNGKNGSDFADYVYHAVRRIGARSARVVDHPSRVWTNGTAREIIAFEAHIVELYAASGELVRSVSCADDGGRWSFDTQGTPHHVEATFNYQARRKKDRFATDQLRQLLAAFGLPWLDVATLLSAQEYLLVNEVYRSTEWQQKIDQAACTFELASDPAHAYYERGLNWVGHMETHAESVIADFERAVLLNSEYEERVRPYLDMARKHIAQRHQ